MIGRSKVALAVDGRLASLAPLLADHFVKAELKSFGYGELEGAIASAAARPAPHRARPRVECRRRVEWLRATGGMKGEVKTECDAVSDPGQVRPARSCPMKTSPPPSVTASRRRMPAGAWSDWRTAQAGATTSL